MATVTSLGVHTPVALPFLISEQIIPGEFSEDHYTWHTTHSSEKGFPVEDELVITEYCVAWSRNGVVRRLYTFQSDGEPVTQAIFTHFPQIDSRLSSKSKVDSGHSSPEIDSPNGTRSDASSLPADQAPSLDKDRALVIFLRTQAHIYFLSGTSHVVHLPFEVDTAFTAPQGLLIQRKKTENTSVFSLTPNPSITSSQRTVTSIRPIRPKKPTSKNANLYSQTMPSEVLQNFSFLSKPSSQNSLPALFTMTDPLVELGLVVSTSSSSSSNPSKKQSRKSLSAISPTERVLYVSSGPEPLINNSKSSKSGPIIVLTANEETGKYTVYNAEYIKSDLPYSSKPKTQEGMRAKRRSSFGPSTASGAATPVARHSYVAVENFQSQNRNTSQSARVPPYDKEDPLSIDPLVSSLDLEFERRGAPTKDNRRVSSLLARTDLSASHDKQTFSDLASGAVSTHAQGAGTNLRRGDSIGSQISRASFGSSFGNPLGRSISGTGLKVARNASGLQNLPVDDLIEELNAGGDFEGFESMGLNEVIEGLRKEMIMVPISTIAPDLSFDFNHSIAQRPPKVFTLVGPPEQKSDSTSSYQIILCVVDEANRKLAVIALNAHLEPSTPKTFQKDQIFSHWRLEYCDLKRGSGVIDAVKLQDGPYSRILVLTETEDERGELTLQAPWSPLVRINIPNILTVWNAYAIGYSSLDLGGERRLRRVFNEKPKSILGFTPDQLNSSVGKTSIRDENNKRHLLKIQLEPRDPQVAAILELCRAVLPNKDRSGEGILVCWWQVRSWLQYRVDDNLKDSEEWTALVMTLICLVLPFLSLEKTKAIEPQPRKSKRPFLRSSSGATTDWTEWNSTLTMESDRDSPLVPWLSDPGWSWMNRHDDETEPKQSDFSLKFVENAPYQVSEQLPELIRLSRAFLESSEGSNAFGPEGSLPTSPGKPEGLRQLCIPTILISLHLFREEQKLNTLNAHQRGGGSLLPLMAQLGTWLGWKDWSFDAGTYFSTEDINLSRWSYDSGTLAGLECPVQPLKPFSILEWACEVMAQGSRADFFTLAQLYRLPGWSNIPGSSEFLENNNVEYWRKLTPRTFSIIELLPTFSSSQNSYQQVIEMLCEAGIDHFLINTLPEGITARFHEAIYRVQPNPPTTWDAKLLHMIDRDDLSMISSHKKKSFNSSVLHLGPTHDAANDYRTIANHTADVETIDSFDGSREMDRKMVTRLIFRDDRRIFEAAKLLNSLKPTVIRCEAEPDWSETELLEAQKDLVQLVAIRTLAVPSGRGLFLFSARIPHRTERYPLFGFNLTCIMRPSGNTVSADKSAFTEDKVCWAFFHAGVSAGLSISRDAKGIDTSWVLYNKPNELSNRHAGFLLALGLNGHLRSIAKWVAFKYLTPKHVMTSIGLLLGLSASYLGTMDSLVTRLLSVHVTRMLPPGAAELNLSALTQTAGIMGIGLLYCGTQHRRMSEVMLSEIEYIDPEDPSGPADSLRDEGYRLAAGFALGFINLGKGRDLRGLQDMHIVERLLGLSVGSRKVQLVHVLDRSMASATVAIALMFMKSNDKVLAKKIDVPDTVLQFDYVRPDIFLLRTLAKHLILWDSIDPSVAWVKSSLPRASEYTANASLKRIQRLSSANMPLFNIIAGLGLAVGIRFAGSGNENARGLLCHYLDQFIRLCRLPALTYDQKLTRSTVRNCQDVLALSAATVMAGTGDLIVFRRLRSLHGRVDPDTPFGSHMAAHMALGALFMGGGSYTFGTSDLAVGALLSAFYPLFPNDILDNASHLQAFRHLWVLAVESRCLVVQDSLTNTPISVPIEIKLRDGEEIDQVAPCLLPSLETIASITTRSLEHWQVVLDFANNPAHLESFKKTQKLYLRRKVAHESNQSAFQANFLSLSNKTGGFRPLIWLFGLESLKNIGMSERGMILPFNTGNTAHISTDPTVVDTKMILHRYLSSGNRDKLWNIRLILEWAEMMERRGETVYWLGQQELERLRAAVWMASSSDALE